MLLAGAAHPAILTRPRMTDAATLKQTFGELLRDVAALANLRMRGQRFLIFGVPCADPGRVELAGLTAAEHRFGARLEQLLARHLEPQPRLRYMRWRVGTHDLGVLLVEDCRDAPYLVRIDAPPVTRAGDAWVRRGHHSVRMRRSELDALYAERLAGPLFDGRVRVQFAGDPPSEYLRLIATRNAELPSRVVAQKFEELIAAREMAADAGSSQMTYIRRLSQARIMGCDEPYIDKGVATLRTEMRQAVESFRLADEKYLFEQQAHPVNLRIALDGECDIECASLVLHFPANVGLSILERHERAANDGADEGYPQIEAGRDAIRVSENYEVLPARLFTEAFREPLRVVVDAGAVGHKIPVRYQVSGRNLRFPVCGKLHLICTEG